MATGTGNLPNPGMSFTPFDILTAAEQNDLVENIESLATGTGIGDGSVDTAAIADEAVTSDKIDGATLLTFTNWTPTFVGGGSMGVSSVVITTARWARLGKMVYFELNVGFTTTGTQNSTINFELPASLPLATSDPFTPPFSGIMYDGSQTSTCWGRPANIPSSQTQVQVRRYDNSTSGWGIGVGRLLNINGWYQTSG